MKKSVILIIATVYLASVFIVGLLGIKMGIYNVVVYAQEIVYVPFGRLDEAASTEHDAVYVKDNVSGKGYLNERVYKTPERKAQRECDVAIAEFFTEGLTFELKFQLRPDNVTKKNLEYQYDKNSVVSENPEKGFVEFSVNSDGNAVVAFKSNGTFILTVRPADGSNISLKVKISVYQS